MKTFYSTMRLAFSGDTVCFLLSIAVFLAALANVTQWPELRAFRFCGICTTFLSLTFASLTTLEVIKYQRRKRAVAATAFFLAATALCFSHSHITIMASN